MLPEFPNLTKCKKCDEILWLDDMEEICTYGYDDKEHTTEWKAADRAEFLDVPDLIRFLELDMVECNIEKEKFIRQQIWWAFNDRIRKPRFFRRQRIFIQESDEVLWKQNCQRLLELLDPADTSDKLMSAELHRNLGEFDACVEILNSVDDDDEGCVLVVEKLKRECGKRNKLLVKLR